MSDDLGPLPRVTRYDLRYGLARREIGSVLFDLRQKHQLTVSQFVSILAGEVSETLKYCMRHEREGEI